MRLILTVSIAVLLLTAAAQPAIAQPATTVQLPSFSYFTVNTTVSVPDRGGISLAGTNRAGDAVSTRGFGPLRNRSIASDRAANNVSVTATILDMAELDAQALAGAAQRGEVDPDAARAELLTRNVGRADKALPAGQGEPRPVDSVAAIRAQNAAAGVARASEAAGYLAKAQEAEAAGKKSVAKIFYQMAARRDTGAIKQLAELRLAALGGKSSLAQK
jgi:hypothetical protein